jgi:precorrin-2 dehydrogenase/sirohydrochlorin ferrochelatase
MIPLLHDFTGQTVLVFGGGPVGARKARRFAEEAHVVVVSPEFCDRSFEPEGTRHPDAGVSFVRAAPGPDDVPSYFERADPALAVAATSVARVNEAVGRVARERGVLVNRADRSGGRASGSVVVPATVRADPVLAAVATGGTAPALSKHLRERIEAELADAGLMAELVGELREEYKSRGVPPERRRAAVRRVIQSDAVWKHLGADSDKARQLAAGAAAGALGDSL